MCILPKLEVLLNFGAVVEFCWWMSGGQNAALRHLSFSAFTFTTFVWFVLFYLTILLN